MARQPGDSQSAASEPDAIEVSQASTGGAPISVANAKTTSTETTYGAQPPRQTRPKQVDAHYPVARMTYLTVSTEDLAFLAASSGIGSIALSAAVYLYHAQDSEPVRVALMFTVATTLAAYVCFGGLLIRVRRRSGLTWWNILGE